MKILKDQTPVRNATRQELQQYEVIEEGINKLDTSGTFDSADKNQRLFYVSFDGTRNDRKDPDPDYIRTNPDIMQTLVSESTNVKSKYIRGVATQTSNMIEEAYKSATGDECEDRSKEAYDAFCEQAIAWHAENPNVEIHLSTVGFSRGATSQRHFANMVQRQGVPDPDGTGFIIPPGGVHQDVMVLYDTVATNEEDLMLSIPSGVKAIQIVANHENRINYDSVRITDPLYPDDPGIFEGGAAGAHCDVGGGYDYHGLSARTLALGHQALKLMGVPILDIPEKYSPYPDHILIHDSGKMFELDDIDEMLFQLGNTEFGERAILIPGNPERFAQLPAEVQREALLKAKQIRLQEEAAHREEVEANTRIREADLDTLQAKNDYEKAVDSGNALDTVGAALRFILKFEDRVDLDNNTGLNADNGALSETEEATLDVLCSAIKLGQAIEGGEGWSIADETTSLLQDIENYIEEYNKANKSDKNIELIDSNVLGFVAAGFDLAQAIDDGDGWAISQSSTQLLESIDKYLADIGENGTSSFDTKFGFDTGTTATAFQAVGSAIGLAINIASLDDAFESGNSTEIAYTVAGTANNAINTYNATATLAGYSTCTFSVAWLGYAVAAVQLADGDEEGAALTAVTTAMMYMGPYAQAISLIIQLLSATRGCDGRIIDKENITEFADDITPGGGEVSNTTMDAIETTAEWGSEIYEGNRYFSGANVDMYDDIGIDIPEGQKGEFGFVQANFEVANPLRYAQYFENLEDISVSDIWDGLYISQFIAANVEQIKNSPQALKSSFTDTPALAEDIIHALASPGKMFSIAGKIFGGDDPDQASASFTLDENGNVAMEVHGDSSMSETTSALGKQLASLMQDYTQGGGRLLIDGTLPEFTMVQGEGAQIHYSSSTGGHVTVHIDDPSMTPLQMQSILVARDRGDHLDSAIKIATNSSGEIDYSRVDEIMAGYGFVKNGIGYSFGETTERYCSSTGSGIIVGGGNVGPEGQLFTAKSSDITSLPLRSDQLPSQRLGEISRIISLKNIFSGTGAELMAMAMTIPGILLDIESSAQEAEPPEETNTDYIKPLSEDELATFLHTTGESGQQQEQFDIQADPAAIPVIGDTHSMQQFLEEHWSDLVRGDFSVPGLSPDAAYTYRESIGYNDLYSDGSTAPQVKTEHDEDTSSSVYSASPDKTTTPVNVDTADESFSATMIERDELTVQTHSAQSGAAFLMAEDSTLRLLPIQLAELGENAAAGSYTIMEENYTLEALGNASNGVVWQEDSGDIRFQPTPGFVGTADFTYTLKTPEGNLVERVATVVVNNVNDAPILANDTFTLDEGETLYLDRLLANDSDPDGDTLQLDHFSGLEHGSLSVENGRLVFVPEEGYFGDVEFSYWVRDHENSYPAMAQVKIHYQDVNQGAAAGEDHFITLEDTPLTTSREKLLANDVEYDGETVTFAGLGASVHGTVTETGDGTISFNPELDYTGDEAGFYYHVTDESGNRSTGWAWVEVLDQRDAPVVLTETHKPISEDEVLAFTPDEIAKFVYDPDGDELHLEQISNITGGTISLIDGVYIFTPDDDFSGTASFDYQANDNHRGIVEGHLEFEVTPVNDPATAGEDSLTGVEEATVTTAVAELLANDSDVDGSVVDFVSLTEAPNEQATVSGEIYTHTPDSSDNGSAALSYSAQDGEGIEIRGTLDINTLAADNPTSFGNDVLYTQEDQTLTTSISELMANDTDADGNGELHFSGLGKASHGQVQLGENGIIEFIPEADYFGDEAGFSYSVIDNEGNESSGWVTVAVSGVNDAPVITGNRLIIEENESVTFTTEELRKFIFDPDGDILTLDGVTNVEGGRMELDNGVYTFIADGDFYGEASLEYLATDTLGEEVSGMLHLGVIPVNDIPEASYNFGSGMEDTEVLFNVAELMDGASDVEDGTELRFGGIESSVNGDVYVDSENIAHFIPNQDYYGSGFFRYNVIDSEGGVGLGYARIDISAVNDAPVAYDDEKILAWGNNSYENVYLATTLIDNDIDVDGDPLHIVAAGDAEYGTVSVDSSGNIHYTAQSEDWVGVDNFTYTISDGAGQTSQATAEIDVKLNTQPDVYSELLKTEEDVISFITQEQLLANDSDIDGDTLRITALDQAEHCNVELMADGSIRFTPELNYNNNYPGQASFRYTVTDGISDPVTAIAVFDIAPVNDTPILTGEHIPGAVEDNVFSFLATDLLTNDSDVETASEYETDTIVFDNVWGAGHGQINYNPDDGYIYYIPNENFNGTETFTYSVTDSNGASSEVESQISVTPVNDAPVVEYDYGSAAEEDVTNYYSIAELLSNDSDADGDRLSISNLRAIEGNPGKSISGGYIKVTPERGADRVVLEYTVSDGHGGNTQSRLIISDIIEHNYAPTFSGRYSVGWKNSYTVWFKFHAEDKNGGNTFGDFGDIVSISASAPNIGRIETQADPTVFKFKGDVDNAVVELTVIDRAGASNTITVNLSHLSKIDGIYTYSPVVLDLDNDGVELLGMAAGVSFDWNQDGMAERSGWVAADDGLLVYDYDSDRVVNFANEISLKDYKPGANTDLEGLQAFDTNEDGIFDENDEEWGSFGVWQDKNSNGQTDEGEFQKMEETDITSINLQSDGEYREESGNIIYGESTFQKEDGRIGEVGDIGLIGESVEFTNVSDEFDIDASSGKVIELSFESTEGESLESLFEEETDSLAAETDRSEETLTSSSVEANETQADNIQIDLGENATTESVFVCDEAEFNRLCSQLQSDMAASTESSETSEDILFIEPDYTITVDDSIPDTDLDSMAIA